MSFQIPTIDIPGLGPMTLTTAQAIRTGNFPAAYDMIKEQATLYGEMHPHFVTTLQIATLAGGAAGLAYFAPSVIAAIGTGSSIQGMTVADLALAQNSGVTFTGAFGTGVSGGATAMVATMIARDTLQTLPQQGYSEAHTREFLAQRQRWGRLEEAELASREPGSTFRAGAEAPEQQVIHPFNADNPFDHYQAARAAVEAAKQAQLPEAEIQRREQVARDVLAHSHVPYERPSQANGYQGAFSEWQVTGGDAEFFLETYEYTADEGHVARADEHGNKFMVGVNPDRDRPWQHPGLAQGTADAITAKEDSVGVAGRLTQAHLSALDALEDAEETQAFAAWQQDMRNQAIDYMLFSRAEQGRPTTQEALQLEDGFEAEVKATMAALGLQAHQDLVSDAQQSGLGLTAEYNSEGVFTGFAGLAAERAANGRTPGYYEGVEDEYYN